MNKRHLLIIFGGFIGLGLLVYLFINVSFKGNDIKIITVGSRYFRAEIVRSREQQMLGLGDRNWICSRCAMLFVFSEAKRQAFWMKGMKFPLDIIWINNGKIVGIEKNISVSSNDLYKSPEPSDMVLEVNSGVTDRFGWEVGDSVSLTD